jgi:hypothetical protein
MPAGNNIGNIITANEINGAGPGSKATAHHTPLAAPRRQRFSQYPDARLGASRGRGRRSQTSAEAAAFPGNYRQNVTIGQIALLAPMRLDTAILAKYRDDRRYRHGAGSACLVSFPASATADQVTANINRTGAASPAATCDRGRDNTVTIDGKSFRNGNLTVLINLPALAPPAARHPLNNKGAPAPARDSQIESVTAASLRRR